MREGEKSGSVMHKLVKMIIKFLCFLLCASFVNCLYYSDGSEESHKDKIVGGHLIDIKLAPYLAQIIENGVQTCGGSIITKEWILTAAHCFDNIGEGKKYSIMTGSSFQGVGGLKHAIAAVHIPRYYDKETLDNDIALVKLRHPIKFDEGRQPIAISTTLPKLGDKVEIAGFGRIGERMDYSEELKAAVVTVIDHHQCQNSYKSKHVDVTENTFCAANKKTDSCEGDSGGPAVIDGKLSGIISFGIGCASSKYPGVYTMLYKYWEWIESKTGLELYTLIKEAC